GDDVRLADGLAAGDRHGAIGIGRVGIARLDEMLARHLVHRAQHRLIADAAPPQRQHEFHPLYAFFAWHGALAFLSWSLKRIGIEPVPFIPAKAGIQFCTSEQPTLLRWVPAHRRAKRRRPSTAMRGDERGNSLDS